MYLDALLRSLQSTVTKWGTNKLKCASYHTYVSKSNSTSHWPQNRRLSKADDENEHGATPSALILSKILTTQKIAALYFHCRTEQWKRSHTIVTVSIWDGCEERKVLGTESARISQFSSLVVRPGTAGRTTNDADCVPSAIVVQRPVHTLRFPVGKHGLRLHSFAYPDASAHALPRRLVLLQLLALVSK